TLERIFSTVAAENHSGIEGKLVSSDVCSHKSEIGVTGVPPARSKTPPASPRWPRCVARTSDQRGQGWVSVPKGHLDITWPCWADGQLILRWIESGGPPTKKSTREGFGTSVIGRMIREQLKGEMRLNWRAEGLACEIVLQV